MMGSTSFRRPFTVKRGGTGTYQGGLFMPAGPETSLTIQATIQPARVSDYDRMQAQLGGERFTRMIRVFTDALLYVADPRADTSSSSVVADVILYPYAPDNGAGRYRIVGAATWLSSGSLSHYTYLAVADLEA